tara:strand:+ start:740 stop:3202 length:2463 start_codon:yes stop_codon:yes gene_type:complete
MSLVKANGAGEVSLGFYNGATSRSLRMQDARLTRTPSSTGNPKKWTFSAWLKRTSLGQSYIFAGSPLASGYDGIAAIYFNGSDQLHTYYDTSGSNPYGNVSSEDRRYRDLGSWYHLCWAVDAENTIHKIWINNVLVSTNTGRYPPNFTYGLNNSGDQMVIGDGSWDSYGSPNFNGYMAEINYLDGQYLEPDSFTETKNGVLIPLKDPSLTYGTNGFRLQFLATGTSADSSGIGADTSGQGNHYAVTSLAAGDVVLDNPENNFNTLNLLDKSGGTFTEANLRYDTSSWDMATGTVLLPSGKWYYEVRVDAYNASSNAFSVGIIQTNKIRGSGNSYYWSHSSWSTSSQGYLYGVNVNGTTEYKISAGSATSLSSHPDIVQGSVIGIFIDLESDTTSIKYNIDGGTPFELFTGMQDVDYTTGVSDYQAQLTFNFGQDSTFSGQETAGGNTDGNGKGDFHTALPSGHTDYLALCSANLPDPTIGPQTSTQADDHFNTVLYTGNNGSQSITGVGFQPDWVWTKSRSATGSHSVFDSSRGRAKSLFPNLTNAEATSDSDKDLVSFDNDGFTLGAVQQTGVNANSTTMVAWNWKANGGTTSSNTDGTITSTVQESTEAGFSIVTYTGTGANGTIGHGLNSAPEMVFYKSRDSVLDWVVSNKTIGGTYTLYLNLTNGQDSTTGTYNSTLPTSTVLHVGTAPYANTSGDDFVAYAFHSVEGYSKIGSYTGNGSTDGTFVYTGFRPAFVLLKRTDTSAHWVLMDSVSDPYNPIDSALLPAGTNGSGTGYTVDFLSNGFKLRLTGSAMNANGATHIYIAFAEQPFKFSNAR